MDAIECGIVKLPRVPVADNIPGGEIPKFRNLWDHIGKDMPKQGRGKASNLDPLQIPMNLQTALEALYGHYEKTFALWRKAGIEVPPCFIIVCNNTSTSKLIHDYIAGFQRENPDGSTTSEHGRFELLRNFDESGAPLARPAHAPDRQRATRVGGGPGQQLPRHGRRRNRALPPRTYPAHGRHPRWRQHPRSGSAARSHEHRRQGRTTRRDHPLRSLGVNADGGAGDANTVTHVLGVRAFGTQLLCEQAVGRALRRQSYEVNDEGRFDVEYADVLGIPSISRRSPWSLRRKPPRKTVQVRAVTPERDACEIRFPRVAGYRVELPEERLEATFNDDSTLELTPDLVGPSITPQ